MNVQEYILTAGEKHHIARGGRYFYLLETNAPVDLVYYRGNRKTAEANGVEGGYWSEHNDLFDTVIVKSAIAQTIKAGVSMERGGNNRLSGAVDATITPGDTLTMHNAVTIGAKNAEVLPANASRKTFMLANNGAGNGYYGGVGVTKNNGIILSPGRDYQPVIPHTAAIHACGGDMTKTTKIGTEDDARGLIFTNGALVTLCHDASAGASNIYRSVDGGVSWSVVQALTVSGDVGRGDVVDYNSGPGQLMAVNTVTGQSGIEIWMSNDYGATWSKSAGSPSAAAGFASYAMAMPGTTVGLMSAHDGTNYKIYKTVDYGATWTTQWTGAYIPYQFVFNPTTWAVVCVTASGQILRSTDGSGTTWAAVAVPINAEAGCLLDDESMIIIGTAGDVYRSTDDGATWADYGQMVTTGTTSRVINIGGGYLLATTKDGYIERSSDHGITWERMQDVRPTAGALQYMNNAIVDIGDGDIIAISGSYSGQAAANNLWAYLMDTAVFVAHEVQ